MCIALPKCPENRCSFGFFFLSFSFDVVWRSFRATGSFFCDYMLSFRVKYDRPCPPTPSSIFPSMTIGQVFATYNGDLSPHHFSEYLSKNNLIAFDPIHKNAYIYTYIAPFQAKHHLTLGAKNQEISEFNLHLIWVSFIRDPIDRFINIYNNWHVLLGGRKGLEGLRDFLGEIKEKQEKERFVALYSSSFCRVSDVLAVHN